MKTKEDALFYHARKPPGKVALQITKSCETVDELSLAYTPGVAYPCLEIRDNPKDVYKYTAKGNLVAVITNGTAVLGLGNIGALAGKPVMEGKAVLFKRFANIDAVDIEINETDAEKFVQTVHRLEPTFGGINLEDIKAPECFYIESELKKRMNIPVFHDDQHGTAIVVLAALTNALKLARKKISDIKLVVSGAGAASIAVCGLLVQAGININNIWMFDSKGLIRKERDDLHETKLMFAQDSANLTLEQVLRGADVFIGVSVAGVLTQDMVRSMSAHPIIFALANPTPEILPYLAKQAVPDVIIATGRSDFPNQVNNVLGFPYIFRGTLDARASEINLQMKLAAADALAGLVDNPEERIIPAPFDSRLLETVSSAVFRSAVDTGVSRI